MKRLMWAIVAVAVAGAAEGRAEDGRAIVERTCATCHFLQRDPSRRDEMVAPPLDMMAAHVRQATGGGRAAFVDHVLGYVRHPDPAKSVDPMAVQRFGLMPPIGDSFPELTDAQLRVVADWMFDQFARVRLPQGGGMGMGGGGRQRMAP